MNRSSLLLSAATVISLVLTANADAQAQRGLKGNSFDDLMQRAQNMLADVRALKCFRSDAEEKQYYEEFNALKDAVHEFAKDYPHARHEMVDPHVDRLETVEDKILNNLIDTRKCAPPGQQQGMTPGTPPAPPQGMTPGTPPPEKPPAPPPAPVDTTFPGTTPAPPPPPPPTTPKADTAPEHSSLGLPSHDELADEMQGMARNDWTALGNYGNFDPSAGSSADQWGGSIRAQFPFGGVSALDLGASYNNVSGDHSSLNNWATDATFVYYFANGRMGPTVGYQYNSETDFHSDTWNYGAFGEYFFPYVTLDGKAGGFSTNSSFTNSSGYYLGGSVTGYVTHNLSFLGSVDFTHFSPMGGSSETDWGLRGTWRPWAGTPLSFWTGYTYSDFSPGNFHVNVISVGAKFDFGNGTTLYDSDRVGVIIDQAAFTPLSLKF
jgi:hypothetical protein